MLRGHPHERTLQQLNFQVRAASRIFLCEQEECCFIVIHSQATSVIQVLFVGWLICSEHPSWMQLEGFQSELSERGVRLKETNQRMANQRALLEKRCEELSYQLLREEKVCAFLSPTWMSWKEEGREMLTGEGFCTFLLLVTRKYTPLLTLYLCAMLTWICACLCPCTGKIRMEEEVRRPARGSLHRAESCYRVDHRLAHRPD